MSPIAAPPPPVHLLDGARGQTCCGINPSDGPGPCLCFSLHEVTCLRCLEAIRFPAAGVDTPIAAPIAAVIAPTHPAPLADTDEVKRRRAAPQINGYLDLSHVLAPLDRAYRYLCGLQLSDQPVSVQREHLAVVRELGAALERARRDVDRIEHRLQRVDECYKGDL